jgi:hypothetical protein
MTLGPRKESHAMKAKPKQQAEPFDAARYRKEVGLRIQQLVAESIEGWRSCENKRCRRAEGCASAQYECIVKWKKSLPPLSPEEAAQRLTDFRRELLARKAGLPIGGQPMKPAQAKEPRGNKPAPVAEQAQLAPGKAERIEQARNDDVASLPAEQDRKRAPGLRIGPRITML